MSTRQPIHKLTKLSSAVLCATAAISSGTAQAQIEEVVVTATKRAVLASELPYNISAVSGDKLEKLGVVDVSDLSKIAPGLVVTDVGVRTGNNNAGIIIRGLNAENPGDVSVPDKAAPPVSVYVNDTPLLANLQLMDVERAEVLRGPQGTIYGSGSLGGNVRYVLRKPDFESFSGQLETGLSYTDDAGGDENQQHKAILNVPVSDNFALRFNASYRRDAGFVDFTGLYQREPGSQFDNSRGVILANPGDIVGSPAALTSRDNADDSDATYFRAAARFESDWLEVNLNYFHQELNADSAPQVPFSTSGDNFVDSTLVSLSPFEGEVDLVSLEVAVDMGFASLTSVTSFTDEDNQGLADLTGIYTNFSFYPSYYGDSPRPIVVDFSRRQEETFTQEIRLVSQGEGSVDWLVGLFYQDLEGDAVSRQFFPGYNEYANACFAVPNPVGGPPCGFGTFFGIESSFNGVPVEEDLAYISNFQDDFEDRAIFGEATWNITDAFQVTGGFRYFEQEYEVSEQGGLVFAGLITNTSSSVDEEDWLFRLNSSFQYVDKHQVYATWSEGFRRGGANALGALATPDTTNYAPDKVQNMELGFKGLLGDRLDYTLAFFYIDWEDIQLGDLCSALSLVCTVNGGDASSKGVEAEVTVSLTDNFTLSAGYTYTDAFLDSAQGVFVGRAASDSRLPGTPKNSFNVTGVYEQALDNGWDFGATTSLAYGDERLTSVITDQRETLDSYVEVDASLSLSNEHWSMRLFARNLFNEDERQGQLATSVYGPDAPGLARRPRTIGLQGSYKF